MKLTFIKLLSLAAALTMVSCASSLEKRIAHNPQVYNGLSTGHKSLVQTGQITEGMSKEAVFLSWGRPDRAAKGSKGGKAFERWSYSAYEPIHSTSIGMGYGGGYWGGGYGYFGPSLYYEPMVSYVPYEARRVEFTGNKVSAWTVAPR